MFPKDGRQIALVYKGECSTRKLHPGNELRVEAKAYRIDTALRTAIIIIYRSDQTIAPDQQLPRFSSVGSIDYLHPTETTPA